MRADDIAQVRRFNRLVTLRAGALDDHFLGRNRPLGASRVLYEIGPGGADLRDLRQRLGLDSGYVSRLMRGLQRQGLVRLSRGSGDRRVRSARLTAAGRREVREMNRRSDDAAAAVLDALPEAQRSRLVAAMSEVHRLLQLVGLRFERVDPASQVARWCVRQYFEELDRRFEAGFDPAESLAADDQDLVPPRGSFLVALVDAEPVACGALKAIGPTTGSLKRMWVAGTVRGLGLGRRMLEALETEARTLGFTTVRLETNRSLKEAIELYRRSGYREVAAFNNDPYADYWFQKELRCCGVLGPSAAERKIAAASSSL